MLASRRKAPRPLGAQSILYGDKVINIVNQKRRDVWPALDGDAYIANGDLGIVVGQYKGQKSKLKGLPSKLEVEFAGQLGHKFGFWKGRFAGEEHSEIARRMTNLFADPLPREVIVGAATRFLEDRLIHRTERGDLVRSKSELVIADKLHARGIDYAYEQRLILGEGRVRYPDFTIAGHASGVTYYWEHLGLLDDPEYRARWERKRAEYLAAGIRPHEVGGGPEGTLIETRDDARGGLDAGQIAKLIDGVVLG